MAFQQVLFSDQADHQRNPGQDTQAMDSTVELDRHVELLGYPLSFE